MKWLRTVRFLTRVSLRALYSERLECVLLRARCLERSSAAHTRSSALLFCTLSCARTPSAALAGAGALDFFDGWIARRFKQTSMVGTFLDPFADKALLACTTVALGLQHVISPWLAGLIVARDVALIAGAVVLRFRTREAGEPFWSFSTVNFKIDPSLISKVNTAMQLGLMCTALTHAAWQFPSEGVLDVTSLVTAGTTLWSGLDYLRLRGVTKVGKGKP